MTRLYRILVLTDHSGHSDQNSIYSILSQMMLHKQCKLIDVASRGIYENEEFFANMQSDQLYGTRINSDFQYSDDGEHFTNQLSILDPASYDIVLMRLPRPISDTFLIWLEEIFPQALIINRPIGILKTSNKKYLTNFRDLCPDIRLCKSIADIEEEIDKFPIVLKPLKEYGGKGLLRIDGDRLDNGIQEYDTIEYLESIRSEIETDGFLSMRYLRNVTQGDKRILVIGGEILAASLRLPAEGNWLCNVSQGGTSVKTEITPREIEIVNSITPRLLEQGVLIYGADTLVDDDGKRVLSEINTMSIGGFLQAEIQTGKPIIKSLLDKIFEYADEWTS